jgi:molybdenum cofactor synthesis domain-containing protein
MDASLTNVTVAVITVSDRCAKGEREDLSGPAIARILRASGANVLSQVVPDGADNVELVIRESMRAGARAVITTGGTGVSPRDLTPEGTAPVLDRELPGIPEAIRRADADAVPTAIMSRGLAGIADGPPPCVIVNLPGSPGGAETGTHVLLTVLPHLLTQLAGTDHGPATGGNP